MRILKADEKVETVKNAKEPLMFLQVHSFLGLFTFYGKFVPSLATIAAPLYNLMRKHAASEFDKKCKFASKKN